MYVEQIARGENISLLYHLTNRIKTVQDMRYEESGPVSTSISINGWTLSVPIQRIYMVAELAQLILSNKAKEAGWTINDYGDKQAMPKDIFVALPSVEVGKEVRSAARRRH